MESKKTAARATTRRKKAQPKVTHKPKMEEKMMDQKQVVKQMLQFNKTAFENTFNAMNMVADQNEKMVNTFLNQATGLPEEGKKAITDWMNAYKKGCENFKSQVDENYQKVEDFFTGSWK